MTKLIILCAAPLAAGCVPATPPGYLAAVADPRVATRPVAYVSPTAGVKAHSVVGPGDWRQANRDVGPRPGTAP